jgi:hypothetical protein
MAFIYKVSEADHNVVEEFLQKPIGHHSSHLQRVLNVLRGEDAKGKYVLVCTRPNKEWTIGLLPGERGKPVKLLKDQVFTNIEEAEREIFRRRWKKYVGRDI